MRDSIDGRIDIFIAILILIALGEVCVQAQSLNSNASQNMDVVLVIDNSGSMDWRGHDPEGARFESVRIFIDKSEEGDNIALIDFSSSSELILPLTKITKARESIMKSIVSTVRSDRRLTDIDSALRLALQELSGNRANLAHTPVVILLTDGEIDVVKGTPEQKQLAAKRSESILFSETIPKYVQNYIPIYTVALKSGMDASVLEKIAKQTKLREQVNERHYFFVLPGTELVEIFSTILGQIKKQSRVTKKYHFTGEPIHQATDTTSLTKKLDVDVLLDHREDMQVTLKGPDGQIVQPSSQGDKYNLYRINNPTPGKWYVSVKGEGENEVIIATNVDDDIKIDLPFASRFKLGEDIPIFANIVYKNKVVEGSVVEVELSGQKHPFELKEFLLSIQKPDGSESGPFPLKRKGGSYTYFYKEADMVGNYTLNFDLKANLMNRDIKLLAQRKVYVFQTVEPPTVLFKKLKEKYSIGDTVPIEFSVTKNARLMQNSSIPVEVSSLQGSEVISVPRKGLKTYSFSFTQTDQEGEYSFTAPKTEEYKVIGFQQSIVIVTPFVFPWKLLVAGITLFAIIGLLILSKIKGWHPWRKRPAKIIEMSELVEEIRKEEDRPIPDEILIWDKYSLAGYIHMAKRMQLEKDHSYYLEYFGNVNIVLNDTLLSEGSAVINPGDIVKLDKLTFEISLSDNVTISETEDIRVAIFDKGDLIRWFVLSATLRPPQESDIIPLTFVRGDIVHIGRIWALQRIEPNDIMLLHPSVADRHITIRRDDDFNYFLKALGKTVLNGSVMEHEGEEQINDGDIVKIGVFTFRIILERNRLRLITESRS